MRSPCCLRSNPSQHIAIAEPIKTAITSQRLGKNIPATASTHETIELLDLCLYAVRVVLDTQYVVKGKQAILPRTYCFVSFL
jgi:hypothetical protein